MNSPESLLSYCGLICQGCPLFWATQETDQDKETKMRIEISRQIKEKHGMDINPEDTGECDGCKSTSGRIFVGCNDCFMRQCAREKKLSTCAGCDDYPCDQLSAFFKEDMNNKSRLDVLRASIK